jgi:uncharacterized SAM-binding protein YcdF (DUF218 family)
MFFRISSLVLRRRRFILGFFVLPLVCAAMLAAWIQWSPWPNPKQAPVFADADAIVVLGGGDAGRSLEGKRLADLYPGVPLIVTGDGGLIVVALRATGIPAKRILHEEAATSTVENAKFTKPMLDQTGAKRVILVTNWFHAPRALAVFKKYQPGRKFVVSFPLKPEPLTTWDNEAQRMERLKAVVNLLVHGVWSW